MNPEQVKRKTPTQKKKKKEKNNKTWSNGPKAEP